MSSLQIIIAIGLAIAAVALYFRSQPRAATPQDPDAAVVAQLKKAGSNLEKPHAIEFFLYLPSEAAAHRVSDTLMVRGFSTKVAPAASGAAEWCVEAIRTMLPEVGALAALRNELGSLARSEQGSYDGWGTPIVK